ncbi:MAG: branched-chain amino acid transaminase [Candidatus Pacearchaeota archaeon]
MQETNLIWYNKKLVPWNECKIHILTHTLHYGSGAFEGIRFYKTEDGKSAIFRLKDHVSRLIKSFSIFGTKIPYSQEEIEKVIVDTVKANLNICREGYIRPIMFHDYGVMGLDPSKAPVSLAVAVWPWEAYLGKDSVKVKTSSYIRLHPNSVIADAKICGYYVNSIFSSLEAKKAGFDEALLLDFKGKIAEGPGENLFIVKHKKILTPKLGNILPGITRASVIEIANDLGYEVNEKNIFLKELRKADEAFFTGTAAEVTAISQIDDKIIGSGKQGVITKKIKQAYLDVVKGKNEKYKRWLTYIQ